jgi:endonuclease YncB( thermonuclease family)
LKKNICGSAPGGKATKVARSSVNRLAELLGGTEPGEGYTYQLAAGESVHIALAFQIPAGGTDPMLALDGQSLPLSEVVEPGLDLADLPQAAGPPLAMEGEIVGASDGETLQIRLDGASFPIPVKLLGIDPPRTGSCFADLAREFLAELVGARVLIEDDSALHGGGVLPRPYVWLVEDDGTRTLLNQRLIADGLVNAYQLPADARFGMWMESSAIAAEEAGIGLWGSCEA